jgi:hypothetical protein
MEDMGQLPAKRYALVSSLYGPGTIACWYLTILSVLVSWTLHPRKRKSGSIDVDLIAILTLPTVAAGHLISQVSMLMHSYVNSPGFGIEVDQYAQSIAATEAPFSIIESFMPISVILFLVAVWMFCLRRAISVAIVGLLCLATECYIHFSSFKELGIRYKPLGPKSDDIPAFSRSFVADFTSLIIAILAILAIFIFGTLTIITHVLCSRRAPRGIRRAGQGRPDENPEASQEAVETSRPTTEGNPPNAFRVGTRLTQSEETEILMGDFHLLTGFGMIFLPVTAMLSMGPGVVDVVQFTTVWSHLKIFAGHFYPHSSNSFSDLDQAVATAAGATVLGFSIYSVANARYEMQSSRQAMRVEEDGIELDRLDQDQTVSGLEYSNGPPAEDERNEVPE